MARCRPRRHRLPIPGRVNPMGRSTCSSRVRSCRLPARRKSIRCIPRRSSHSHNSEPASTFESVQSSLWKDSIHRHHHLRRSKTVCWQVGGEGPDHRARAIDGAWNILVPNRRPQLVRQPSRGWTGCLHVGAGRRIPQGNHQ